jgi:hypothetical protein
MTRYLSATEAGLELGISASEFNNVLRTYGYLHKHRATRKGLLYAQERFDWIYPRWAEEILIVVKELSQDAGDEDIEKTIERLRKGRQAIEERVSAERPDATGYSHVERFKTFLGW